MNLSVIIVSFNTKKLTKQAIDSVFSEGSRLKLEVIVVDNNSTDGSLEMLEKIAQKYKTKINLIKNKKNTGFAFANNQGMKLAKGEYLFLLNSDTKVMPKSFGELIKFAKSKEDAGVVGPKLLNKDGSLQKSCLRFPTIGNAVKEYWFGSKGLFDKYSPNTTSVVDSLVAAAFLITPKARRKVGMLDEKYWFYFEDIDYCRRVKDAGLKVYYYPEVEIYHLHGASGKSMATSADQWKRLIPSSKIYHGLFKHYLLTVILWSGQKWQKIKKRLIG